MAMDDENQTSVDVSDSSDIDSVESNSSTSSDDVSNYETSDNGVSDSSNVPSDGNGIKEGMSNSRTYDGRGGALNSLARKTDGLSRGLNRAGNGLSRAGKALNKYANKNPNTRIGKAAGAVGKKMGSVGNKVGGVASKVSNANKKVQMANNINNVRQDPEVAKEMAVNTAKTVVVDKAKSAVFAVTKKSLVLIGSIVSAIGCFPLLIIFLVAIVFLAVIGAVLIFDDAANAGSGVATGDGVCSYNVDGKSVSDIKVRLLNCEGDTPVEGEELIDFETYITGVVYQETGDSSYEALKAQAVAARSYALKRPGIMNGGFGVTLKEENGQWILSLRSCTNDQVFCHPDKGCWSNRRGGQTSNSNKADWPNCTVHSGEDTSKTWHRGPLAEDSDVRKAVEETRGEVLVDKNGKIVNTDFLDTNQQYWDSLAKQGKDYLEILIADYGDQGAARTSSNCTSGSSTINDADINTLINLSQEEAWEQLIGKRTSDSHPSVSKSIMDDRMTTVTVPIRSWKSGAGHNPQTDTIKKEATIRVNKALAGLWQAFFTDVYNEATDFVIASMDGCYVYRNITGGTSLSPHAYGVACDVNASTMGNGYYDNSLSKSKWEDLPETRTKYQIVYQGSKVVEIAHKYTIVNGSDWNDPHDAMHFSFISDKTREFAQNCQGKISCSS